MLSLPSLSFADDITLLATHPTFLSTFMNLCYEYSIKWRVEFHNDKSCIVTSGETKRIPCQSIKQRNWVLGNEIVDERYEYKNLGVVKNYAGSLSSNVEDNIDALLQQRLEKFIKYAPKSCVSWRFRGSLK